MSISFSSLVTESTASSSSRKKPKKPKRPLTAYHIYYQIEREYIIQSMAGEDTDQDDKSIYEGKTLFQDVPKRYQDTKLSPDWYFGPGRRAKRRHRKQHVKISFFELSRVIATRWTKLQETDPDIKQFVSKLASEQFGEYKRELKEYRESLAMNKITPVVVSKRSSTMKQPAAPQAQEQQQQTSPGNSSSPLHGNQPREGRSSMKSPVPPSCQKSDEIDLVALRDAFELEYSNSYQQKSFKWGERTIEDDFVDLCDDEILSMWKSTHARAKSSHARAA